MAFSRRVTDSCSNGTIIVIIMKLCNCLFCIKMSGTLGTGQVIPDASRVEISGYTENDMRIGSVSHSLLMLIAGGTASLILAAGSARAEPRAQTDLVEFEKMTWVEVKSALAAGKTTALIYSWRPAGGLRGGRQQAQRTLRSSPCVLL
jgi:hypothetical protein